MVRIIILLSILMILAPINCGCTIPESVKVSARHSLEANQAAHTELLDNGSVVVAIKHLGAAEAAQKPVIEYIGEPEHPIPYTPEAAILNAQQAHLEVKMQKMFQGMIDTVTGVLTDKFKILKTILPDSKGTDWGDTAKTGGGALAVLLLIVQQFLAGKKKKEVDENLTQASGAIKDMATIVGDEAFDKVLVKNNLPQQKLLQAAYRKNVKDKS